MPEEAIILAVEARDKASAIFSKLDGMLKGIGQHYKGVKKDAEEAEKATTGFGKAAPWIAGVGIVGASAAIGVGLIAKASIDAASQYQTATSVIAAQGEISIEAANKIGDAFLNSAGSTVYSAQEQADAIGPLVGQIEQITHHAINAADSTKIMSAAMNLAEATGNDLAASTKDVVNVMQVYHQPVTQAATDTNYLFEAARVTGQSIDQITTAVDRVAGRLGPLAPSLKDTTTLIADLSAHGLQGRLALTAATTSLNTLTSGSKTANAEIKALHLQVFNANGTFVGMGSIIAQLGPKFQHMTMQQRLAAEKMLFGASAGKELDAVLLAGAKGFNALGATIGTHNAAQMAAEKRASTYAEQQKKLTATIDDMKVMLGEQLIPVVQQFLGMILPVVTSIAQWINTHKQLSAHILIAVAIIGTLIAAVAAVTLVVGTFNAILFANPIGLVVLAIAALVAGVIYAYTHWKWFRDIVNAVWNDVLKPLGEWIWNRWVTGWNQTTAMVSGAWDKLKAFGAWLGATFGPIVDKIGKGIGGISSALGAIGGGAKAVLGGLHIPGFAEGGMVTGTGPMLAVLHPPEMIVPMSGGSPNMSAIASTGSADMASIQDLLGQILAVLSAPPDMSGADAALYALIQKLMQGRNRALVGGF